MRVPTNSCGEPVILSEQRQDFPTELRIDIGQNVGALLEGGLVQLFDLSPVFGSHTCGRLLHNHISAGERLQAGKQLYCPAPGYSDLVAVQINRISGYRCEKRIRI